MREFERSIERGDDATVANFVLAELRKIVRAPTEDLTARTDDPMRLVFRPLDRFLVDNVSSIRPGQIRRSSLGPVWIWLGNEGIPDKLRAFEAFLKTPSDANDYERAVREVQTAAAEAIAQATAAGPSDGSARQRPMARFGSDSVSQDIVSIGTVLGVRDALDTLNSKLPGQMRTFAEIPDQVGHGIHKHSRASDTSELAIRAIDSHAASSGAMAGHSARHFGRGVRR